ncbi:MAG: hemerythrin domain-containing protein [Myxococcota bacterium]
MGQLSTLYADHHATCDTAFADAEAAGVEGRWSEAATSLARFDALMKAHLASEEETLFPAFERATGMTQGPTQVMRMEHEHMRALLGRLAQAVGAKDGDEFAGAAETLLVLMQQHNLKEERMLYPMCDQALAADGALFSTCQAQLTA